MDNQSNETDAQRRSGLAARNDNNRIDINTTSNQQKLQIFIDSLISRAA